MPLIWAGLVFISMGGPIIFGELTLFEEEIFASEHSSCSHDANNKNVLTCSLFWLFYVIYIFYGNYRLG
jgi:hypothetical protein